MPAEPASPVSCPRCAYDLRGQLDKRGTDDGTCPECGLVLSWRQLLNPDNAGPPWFCESRSSARRRYLRTFGRALRPGRFFRYSDGVRLASPARTRPRIVFASVLMLLLIALAMLLPAAACLAVGVAAGKPMAGIVAGVDAAVWLFGEQGSQVAVPWTSRVLGIVAGAGPFHSIPNLAIYGVWTAIAWTSLTPFAFLALRQTRRTARVSFKHLARAGVYSAGGASLILWLYILPIVISVIASALFWHGLPPGTMRGRPQTSFAVFDAIVRAGEFAAYLGPLLLLPLVGAWLLYWWSAVTSRYFRLSQSFAVSLVMVVIGFLAAIALVFVAAWPGPSYEIGYLFFEELA